MRKLRVAWSDTEQWGVVDTGRIQSRLLRRAYLVREDVRIPCENCGHTVFLEILRAPKGSGPGNPKDGLDVELCEKCRRLRAA